MNVMNLIVILILLFCSCSKQNNTQAASVTNDSTECEKGRVEAQSDIQKNALGRYYYGLPTDEFQMYVRILKDKYGIEVKGGGDVVDDSGTCYNEVMDDQIKRKFGKDFFLSVQKKIDSLYAAGLGDRQPFYPGGGNALEVFFACNVNIPGTKHEKKKVYVDLQIDSTGKVQSVAIRKGIDKDYDSEAIRVSKLLVWSPAIENQKTVASRQTIAVPFDPGLRQRIRCK